MFDFSIFTMTLKRASHPVFYGAAILALISAQAKASPPGELPFGVYDPHGDFKDETDVQIEHLFLPWEDVYLPSLKQADQYALDRSRSILATIEPWTWTRSERNTPAALRRNINDGVFDAHMSAICAEFAQFTSPVTVRWAQEMEDVSGQFIWAGWKPDDYINAYKRFVDLCRDQSKDIQYMWSPLGYDEMKQYYPGEDYVDVVGLSVFGLQAWEKKVLGNEQTFRDIFAPRYKRALAFGKPIVISELGYSGDANYVAKWENDVRQDLDGFDELRAVIYFNQREVYPWPDGFGLPNWRFGQNILSGGN